MPSFRPRVSVTQLSLALGLSIPAAAHANAAAPFIPSGESGERDAYLLEPTMLRVTAAKLSIRCTAADDEVPTCRFKTTYTVSNPSGATATAMGAFYGGDRQQMQITVDGRDARVRATGDQLKAIDARVRKLDPNHDQWIQTAARSGFSITVAPGASATLVFSSPMHDVRTGTGRRGYGLPGISARHVLITGDVPGAIDTDFVYALSPLRDWAATDAVDVEVFLDPNSSYEIASHQLPKQDAQGYSRARLSLRDSHKLDFAVREPEPTVVPGGVLLGIGGGIDHSSLVLRAGYEFGAPHWLAWSVVGETDADNMWRVAAGAQALTDTMMFIPYFGLGLGGVLRNVDGTSDIGIRAEISLGVPFIGVTFPFDVYPAADDEVFEASVLFQLSI